MESREILLAILLVLLIVCAVAVNLTRHLLSAVIIYLSYSSIMCIVWILLESPDLAITEAAVGAGISGTLFLVTLKKIQAENDETEGEADAAPAETYGAGDGVVRTAKKTDAASAAPAGPEAADGRGGGRP